MGMERAATSGTPAGADIGGALGRGAKLEGLVRDAATPVFGDSCCEGPTLGLALAASAPLAAAAAAASGESHGIGSPSLASSAPSSTGTASICITMHTFVFFPGTAFMMNSLMVTSWLTCTSPLANIEAHSELMMPVPYCSPSES